jgi:RimJ/RimL family protein N-acetyltransferase
VAEAARPQTRRLVASDGDRFLRHLLRLDADDRRSRFGGQVTEEYARAYCARFDWRRSLVLGWFVAGELRAVGELRYIDGALPARAAEVAVSVERPFRGRGVGTELCRRLIVRARNRLVTTVHMLCLLDNRRVQRIARGLGGALAFYPGEAEARLDLRWPDALTGFEEWLDEAAGVLQGEGAAAFRPQRQELGGSRPSS